MSNRIDSLQWLRAIAAFWVLFTHVFQRMGLQPFGYTFSGQWGVDIFFILSGFIIYFTTKDSSSWARFARKRIFRIFPLYLFCVAAYYFFFHITSGIKLTGVQWTQNVLMVPFSDAIGYHSLLVGQAWSTCYELYFYFILAMLLLLNIPKQRLIVLLLALYGLGLLAGCFGGMMQYGWWRYLLSLIASRHIFMFCIGISIAMWYGRITPPIKVLERCTPVKQMTILSLLFIVYIAICLTRYNFFSSIAVSTVAFIICLLSQPLLKEANWANHVMTYLGDISFSVYLVHSLIIRILMFIGVNNYQLLLPTTILATIILSSLTYKLVEKPFINLAKR